MDSVPFKTLPWPLSLPSWCKKIKITWIIQSKCLSVNESAFISDGTGSKIFCCSGWVGSDIFGLSLGLENFSLESQIFSLSDKKNLFRSGQKVPGSKTAWPLIYCFYARVGSGPISNFYPLVVILINSCEELFE